MKEIRMQISMTTRMVIATIAITLLTLITIPTAYAQAHDGTTDPCSFTRKSSTPFFLNSGDFHTVIAGVPNRRIFVCGVVFSGSATEGFNINFAGISSGGTGFTALGSLFATNNVVVSAGGGSSTQFTVPLNEDFAIELGGNSPLQASGWVSYVRVADYHDRR
jgi:hypothetical protein